MNAGMLGWVGIGWYPILGLNVDDRKATAAGRRKSRV